MVAINSMKKHALYGSALFWVDVHKKSDKPPFEMPKSLYIGVKVDIITKYWFSFKTLSILDFIFFSFLSLFY